MASNGVIKVILVGNLGMDPEVRYMPNGGAVANVSIANSETWKDKQTGDPREQTEWHRVVFYRRLAEIVGEFLKKGSKVYVEGSLRTRKWQGKDGQDRYTTEIIANEMQMLDSRGGGTTGMGKEEPGSDFGVPSRQASASGDAQQPATGSGGSMGADEDFDDDIPF